MADAATPCSTTTASKAGSVLMPVSAHTPGLRSQREKTTKCMQELMRMVLRKSPKQILQLSQPFKSSSAAAFNDRFTIGVQVCSGKVHWTLLLDGMRPENPPDIIFDEASEDFSMELKYAELEAVKTWDVTRETALLELLLQLHKAFLQYHHMRVQRFSDARLKFELESIMAHAPHAQMRILSDHDLTVECVIPMYERGDGGGSSHGPPTPHQHETGEMPGHQAGGAAQQEACRLVLVMDQELKHVRTCLEYPASTPREQRAVCPAWINGTSHAFDLIPMTQALVQGKLAERRVRTVVLEELCAQLAPLAVDTRDHKAASFLCSLDASFAAVVHVSMSDMFPHEPPRLVLQSVVQLMNRLPLTHTLAHYGWSAAWPVAEMVKYLLSVMSAQVTLFRKQVTDELQARGAVEHLARAQ